MSALSTFVPHTDFSQDFRRRGVVNKMARKNPMQPKRLEPTFQHGSSRFHCIAFPPIRDTDPVPKFRATMVRVDAQSHPAAQRSTLTDDNDQSQAASRPA